MWEAIIGLFLLWTIAKFLWQLFKGTIAFAIKFAMIAPFVVLLAMLVLWAGI